jgi:hypothetical protein
VKEYIETKCADAVTCLGKKLINRLEIAIYGYSINALGTSVKYNLVVYKGILKMILPKKTAY